MRRKQAGRSLASATSKGVEFAYDEMELGDKRLEMGLNTVKKNRGKK